MYTCGRPRGAAPTRSPKMQCRTMAGASPRPTGCVFRGARRPGVPCARPCMAHIFLGAHTPGWPHLPFWGNSPSVLTGPYIYFMGMFRRQRAATHFANSGKVGKTPFKGEMFRFISPPESPHPTPTNLVLVSSRSLVSPERARLAPSATRPLPMEIACAGFPLGSRFGPPIGCTPRGRGTEKRRHREEIVPSDTHRTTGKHQGRRV